MSLHDFVLTYESRFASWVAQRAKQAGVCAALLDHHRARILSAWGHWSESSAVFPASHLWDKHCFSFAVSHCFEPSACCHSGWSPVWGDCRMSSVNVVSRGNSVTILILMRIERNERSGPYHLMNLPEFFSYKDWCLSWPHLIQDKNAFDLKGSLQIGTCSWLSLHVQSILESNSVK